MTTGRTFPIGRLSVLSPIFSICGLTDSQKEFDARKETERSFIWARSCRGLSAMLRRLE